MNGNKMTRVLAILVCAFMLIQSMAIGALAADIDPEAVVYVKPEVVSAVATQVGMNYIYVDVVTENCDNDQTVMAYLVDAEGNLVTVGYAPVGSNKAEIKLGAPDDAYTATYKIVVALNKAADVFPATVYYIGVEDVTGFFEAINMTEGDVKTELDEHYSALSVIKYAEDEEGNVILALTGEDYEDLSKDAKKNFADLILNGVNGKFSLGKGEYNAENSEDFVKEAYIIASYNTGDLTDSEMAELLYKFASVIGFDAEDENLYGKIEQKDTLVKVLETIDKDVESVEQLNTALEKAAAIQIVNETHWLNLVNVVAENNELFGVDEDEIEDLLDSKRLRKAFCEEFKGTYYSVEEIQDAWEDAFKAAKKEINKESSSGGGGGGGGGSVVVNTVSTQISDTENNYDPNVEILDYYTDMGEYGWASDAILNLTKKEIVTGYGDKKFAPANSLTRAEFMKMLVNVFGLADITATSTFTDVDPNAWYYVYVASAEKLGLAQGYGNGTFGVNDPVTRQDAVTLIYRTAKLKGLSTEKFKKGLDGLKDKGEIAPYAVDAVEALYNAGVYLDASDPKSINVFEPTRNATRAYVVVLLNQLYIYMSK